MKNFQTLSYSMPSLPDHSPNAGKILRSLELPKRKLQLFDQLQLLYDWT
jgi:hypothetical protein